MEHLFSLGLILIIGCVGVGDGDKVGNIVVICPVYQQNFLRQLLLLLYNSSSQMIIFYSTDFPATSCLPIRPVRMSFKKKKRPG
jgi:hypothetical protein